MNNKEDFKKHFDIYWYKHKSLGQRLRDNMNDEFFICSEFYASMIEEKERNEE